MAFRWLIVLLFSALTLQGQQLADTLYTPSLPRPLYEAGKGPLILIDEGHHNFHTRQGRYTAFAGLLERDGYRVESALGYFQEQTLDEARILVISNALHKSNVSDWFLPNPSAFTPEEIEYLNRWVKGGGRLFLIADHMPLAGAASDLAASFGFEFTNGFVFESNGKVPSVFSLDQQTLQASSITKGRTPMESVTEVATFTGQAFKIPENAQSVLTFSENFTNLLPDTAWVFTDKTPRIPAQGWHQGAFMAYGQGKLVVFGEAAMFSAQLAGPEKRKMGMNHPRATQNYQLLLNIIHWLDDQL